MKVIVSKLVFSCVDFAVPLKSRKEQHYPVLLFHECA